MNFDITIQENQLSLRNRTKHLCKYNDVADLLKHPFTVCVTTLNLVVLGLIMDA